MTNEIILLSPYCEVKYRISNLSVDLIRFYLQDKGYQVNYYDLSGSDPEYKKLTNTLGDLQSPIIGITGYTRERFHAYRLIKKIKQEYPDATIVVGGHHFGYLPEETLENLPEVDIVVRGEGEVTFKEICDSVINNTDLSDIDGITFRGHKKDILTGKNQIISTKDAILERELDKFRTWDAADFKKNLKWELTSPKMDPGGRYISIMATRGCPSACNFCSLSTDIVRFRSIENVVDEIEAKVKITGIKKVSFKDSSLTVNKNYVRQLCDEILARNLDIQWQCYSRVDMAPALLDYMRKAGCTAVEVALESGSPDVLKAIGKGISIEKYQKYCKHAHELGIKVWTFIIVSSTSETYEDALMTYDVLNEASRHTYAFGVQVTRITPDTKLHKISRDNGVLPADFDWFDESYRNKEESLFNTDMYETLPLYIEKMSVKEIQIILEKYEKLRNKSFVYSDILWAIVVNNLSPRRLKKLSLKELYRKINRFIVMIFNLKNTSDKVAYYTKPKVDIESIVRPQWQQFKKRSFSRKVSNPSGKNLEKEILAEK